MDTPNITGVKPKQIGKWTCHKLECLSDYIEAYARTIDYKNYCYLELYAECNGCFCKGTDCCIEGLAPRALKIRRKFRKYVFVVSNRQEADGLKQLTATYNASNNVEIIVGNCNNERVLRRILDSVPRSASSLVLIDPAGYEKLHWATIEQLARHGTNWQDSKMDLLIIFPLEMALLRNLTRPECSASITRLYGNQKWEQIVKQKLYGEIGLDKVRYQLVELFKDGLKHLGYRFVEDFKPVFLSHQPFYHLILASDNKIKTKLFENAWGKPRYLPCELLYSGNPIK